MIMTVSFPKTDLMPIQESFRTFPPPLDTQRFALFIAQSYVARCILFVSVFVGQSESLAPVLVRGNEVA